MANLLHRIRRRLLGAPEPPPHLYLELPDDGSLRPYLSAIPSQTTLRERLYLYYLARELSGAGTLLELGPFLGGTTRALAHGIMQSRDPERRLITVDRFEGYCDAAMLRGLGVAVGAGERSDVPFREIFESLHASEPYWPRLDTVSARVPDSPEQPADYAFLTGVDRLAVVLVDGCKSWYSVKSFMSNVAPRCDSDTWIVFQDYGWHTCFWIPAFVESFPECFEFAGRVDSSYVFRLRRPVSAEVIAARFADTPQAASGIDEILLGVQGRELAAGRTSGAMTARLQRAAFHAHVGATHVAHDILREMRRDPALSRAMQKRVDELLVRYSAR